MEGVLGGRRLILAPMAGVTDPVFRRLCREAGADLAFTEMVSAKGLSYANDKTRHLVELGEGEDDVSVQLFGHESASLAEQAAWVERELDGALVSIDINMGCPVRKIVSKGDGSALMKEPDLAAEIIRAVKSAVDVPVTCKFRRSWDPSGDHASAPEFAQRMEDAGADAVCVHGRYSTQMYRGSSDRGCITRTKQAVTIPVIGNGDVFSAADASALVDETGCDAVMIARGAQGNPWIFAAADAVLDGRPEPAMPSIPERIEMARRHVRLLDERTRGRLAPMRKHAMDYVRGMPGASRARDAFSSCSTREDFEEVLDRLEEASDAA